MGRVSKSESFAEAQVRIESRVRDALGKIVSLTDSNIRQFSEEAAKLAQGILGRQLIGSEESTGALQHSIEARVKGTMAASVVTTVENESGYGYGMAQEWGWKKPANARGKRKKVKGKHFVVKAIFGMLRKWRRGEHWR